MSTKSKALIVAALGVLAGGLLVLREPKIVSGVASSYGSAHAYSYLNNTDLIWLHVISDSVIFLSYAGRTAIQLDGPRLWNFHHRVWIHSPDRSDCAVEASLLAFRRREIDHCGRVSYHRRRIASVGAEDRGNDPCREIISHPL